MNLKMRTIIMLFVFFSFFFVACTSYTSCDDFCIAKKYIGGNCEIQPVKNNICGDGKIYQGVAVDCKPDLGIMGIEKGCCCIPINATRIATTPE
jgi:hypothetical protein